MKHCRKLALENQQPAVFVEGKDCYMFNKVDDDGVTAQAVTLVDKGQLVDLPMSRIPTKKIEGSNGHARGTVYSNPKGRTTNLIITSDRTLGYDELKKQLIQYCRDLDLEYGIIVRKLKDKNLEMERK